MPVGEPPASLLRNLMEQVDSLDLDIIPDDDGSKVSDLLVPGLEMSKIFAIVSYDVSSPSSRELTNVSDRYYLLQD